MVDETEVAKKESSGDGGHTLDDLLKCVDSLNKRLDSLEDLDRERDKAREDARHRKDDDDDDDAKHRKDEDLDLESESKDPKKVVADKKRHRKDEDGEEKEKEKERGDDDDAKHRKDSRRRKDDDDDDDDDDDAKHRKDARRRKDDDDDDKHRKDARSDSSLNEDDIRRQIAELQLRLPKHFSEEERSVRARIQSRADSVANALGQEAPPPMSGESTNNYRIRLLKSFQKHSPGFKELNLDEITGNNLLPIEDKIYADAMEASRNPDTFVSSGGLVAVPKKVSGREIIEYYGDPGVWMDQFSARPLLMKKINTK